MKKNIHKVDYNGNPDKNGRWWKWEEICDRCGKETEMNNYLHSRREDESELDLCTNCLRYLMDNKISYQQAVVLYKKR